MNPIIPVSRSIWPDAKMAPAAIGTNSASQRLFRDLSEPELTAALNADIPGAMSEESLRATLAAHPEIRREAVIPSWGERCVPQ